MLNYLARNCLIIVKILKFNLEELENKAINGLNAQ